MRHDKDCKEFSKLILPYLSEKMDEQQTEQFELHYFTCENCFLNLKIAQHLHSGSVPVRLKSQRRSFVFKPIFAFSSFLLLFIVSAVLFFVINSSNGSDLHYGILKFLPPSYIKTETRGNYNEEIFDRAMKCYNNKDYSAALKDLNLITSKKNNNYKVLFFKGICNLLTDKLEAAEKDFSVIIQNMNPSYFDEAIYYKGITLLRKGEKRQAIATLNNLSTDKYSPFSKKAISLINRIEGL